MTAAAAAAARCVCAFATAGAVTRAEGIQMMQLWVF